MWDTLFCIARLYDVDKSGKLKAGDVRALIISCAAMTTEAAEFSESSSMIDPQRRYQLTQRLDETLNFLDAKCCYTEKDFAKTCNMSLFSLIAEYYNDIRVLENYPLKTYTELNVEYDVEKMNKKWWGSRIWELIHGFAINSPVRCTTSYYVYYKSFIVTLSKLLPCEECRRHLTTNLSENPLDGKATSNHALFKWSFMLHNKVNKMLKMPEWSWQKAAKEYYC